MWEQINTAFEKFFQQVSSYFVEQLPAIVSAFVVAFLLYHLLNLIWRVSKTKIKKSFDDQLIAGFFEQFFFMVKWIIVIIVFLSVMGKSGVITKIAGAAGISAFIIGFAFKDIGENFLAGIILAFKRPFRLGDTISTVGIEGVIRGISLREIHLKTVDGKDVYIPNGQLIKNALYNYTIDGYLRQEITFQIDYFTDVNLARSIVLQAATELDDVQKDTKSPEVFINSIAPPVVEVKIYYWMDTFTKKRSSQRIRTDIIDRVLTEFIKKGITIPNSTLEVTTIEKETA